MSKTFRPEDRRAGASAADGGGLRGQGPSRPLCAESSQGGLGLGVITCPYRSERATPSRRPGQRKPPWGPGCQTCLRGITRHRVTINERDGRGTVLRAPWGLRGNLRAMQPEELPARNRRAGRPRRRRLTGPGASGLRTKPGGLGAEAGAPASSSPRLAPRTSRPSRHERRNFGPGPRRVLVSAMVAAIVMAGAARDVRGGELS